MRLRTPLALINNFDDARGGQANRSFRFQKVFPGLDILNRGDLASPSIQSEWLNRYDGFILSGSPHNVTDIELPNEMWMKNQQDFIRRSKKPILGVCFGHQLLCHAFGASVRRISARRPAHIFAHIRLAAPTVLFSGKAVGFVFPAEQTHQQEVSPMGFPLVLEKLALADPMWAGRHSGFQESVVQMVRHKSRPFFGVQFHPETYAGAPRALEQTGAGLLQNFQAFCRDFSSR